MVWHWLIMERSTTVKRKRIALTEESNYSRQNYAILRVRVHAHTIGVMLANIPSFRDYDILSTKGTHMGEAWYG